MYCSKCGFKNVDGAVFCEECGAKLKVKKPAIEEKEVVEEVSKPVTESKVEIEKKEEVHKEDVKKEEVKVEVEGEAEPSKNKRGIIVLIIIILVVAGVFFGFNYQSKDNSDNKNDINKVESENESSYQWGTIYYNFLKDLKSKEDKSQYGLSKNVEDVSIKFYQADNSDMPVMLVNYKEDGKAGCNIYFLKDKTVNVYPWGIGNTIEKLYNIEDNEEKYYIHQKKEQDDYHTFYEVDTSIKMTTLSYSESEKFVHSEEFSNSVVSLGEKVMDKNDPNSTYNQTFKEGENDFSKIDFSETEEEFLNNVDNIIKSNEKEIENESNGTSNNAEKNGINEVANNASNNTITNNTVSNTTSNADLDFGTNNEIVYVWTDAEPQSEFLKDTVTFRKDGTIEKIEESMGTATLKGTYTYENGKIIANYTEEEVIEPGMEGNTYNEKINETNEFEFINGILYENIRSYKHEFVRQK